MNSVKQHQHGLTMVSFIFLLVLALSVVYLGIKIVPHYIDYYTVRNIMNNVAQETKVENMSQAQIKRSLQNKLSIDYSDAVSADDIRFTRSRNGNGLSVSYVAKEHLVGNISVLLNFDHNVELGRVNN